jgi:hypothetical protein
MPSAASMTTAAKAAQQSAPVRHSRRMSSAALSLSRSPLYMPSMAEAACGTPSTTLREKAKMQLTAVKAATSSLPPAVSSMEFTASRRSV